MAKKKSPKGESKVKSAVKGADKIQRQDYKRKMNRAEKSGKR